MKAKFHSFYFALALLAWVHQAAAQGTAFTYQGRLFAQTNAANGTYNLTFSLFNVSTGGGAIAGPVTNNGVIISNGLFTVLIDFGPGVLTGHTNWLEIGVETNGVATFTTLTPRQQLTPAPYAIFAENVSATAIGGTYGNPIVLNNPADSFTGSYNGNGAGLTNVWLTSGNAGTVAGPSFLGTTDNQPLELHVNGQRALRLEPNAGAGPNVIGGAPNNSVVAGIVRATIAGGEANTVSGPGSTIGGGYSNTGGGIFAVVGGGYGNQVNGAEATVAGGDANIAGSQDSTVAGGVSNQASGAGAFVGGGGFDGSTFSGNTASGGASTVAGGFGNSAANSYAAVGGGINNQATGADAIVGGGELNVASGPGTFIGGGYKNNNSGIYSVVGGGYQNFSTGPESTVAGGAQNTAGPQGSTVAGGFQNQASGAGAFVGGGGFDGSTFSGNTASGEASTVAGGFGNSATNSYTAVGGGINNQATGADAIVGGGELNVASGPGTFIGGGYKNNNSGIYSVVGGGYQNLSTGPESTVAGGAQNTAGPQGSTVAGGFQNQASGAGAFVGGGGFDGSTFSGNTASGAASTVGGGMNNIASGYAAVVMGGSSNSAQGAFSFAGGQKAVARFNGTFVWADSNTNTFDPYGLPGPQGFPNSFNVRSTAGFYIATGIDPTSGQITSGVYVAGGGSGWNTLSDRNAKTHFSSLDAVDVLRRLASIPVLSWNYKSQNASVRHIGPMAQDFNAAFGVGEPDETGEKKYINSLDEEGVALAAIQGLNQKLNEKDAEIQTLKAKAAKVDSLEKRLAELEQAVQSLTRKK